MNPRAFNEDLRRKLDEGKTLNDALSDLRSSGATILQSTIAVNACQRYGMTEAKRLVNTSPVWADAKEKNEQLQRETEQKICNTPITLRIAQYIIVIGLLGICTGIGVRGEYLSRYYFRHAPRQMNLSQGTIHETIINHHDGYRHYTPIRVYLTDEQWLWFSPTADAIFAGIFCVAIVSGFVLGFRWKILQTKFGKTKN